MEEYLLDIRVRKLKGGGYLATSESIQGLVAEGRTIAETMEIARDVARKIIESCMEHGDPLPVKIDVKQKGALNLKIPVGLGV